MKTLHDLRVTAGLTLQAAAASAGLSISTVQKLEAGSVAAPAYATLAALARAYAVPVELVAEAHAVTLAEAAGDRVTA
mgnify:CR=1 FL=1